MRHTLTCFALLIISLAVSSAVEPVLDVTVTVDFGKHLGQNFGTLFEATDASGRAVCGAGFAGTYNTHFRADRHALQFYIRPVEGADAFAREPLPRPTTDLGVYLFDIDGAVYANASGKDRSVRMWAPERNEWHATERFPADRDIGDRPRLDPGRECGDEALRQHVVGSVTDPGLHLDLFGEDLGGDALRERAGDPLHHRLALRHQPPALVDQEKLLLDPERERRRAAEPVVVAIRCGVALHRRSVPRLARIRQGASTTLIAPSSFFWNIE